MSFQYSPEGQQYSPFAQKANPSYYDEFFKAENSRRGIFRFARGDVREVVKDGTRGKSSGARLAAQILDFHRKIEKCAYELWQAEGCREGNDLYYWFRAERQLETELQAASFAEDEVASLPKSSGHAQTTSARAPRTRL